MTKQDIKDIWEYLNKDYKLIIDAYKILMMLCVLAVITIFVFLLCEKLPFHWLVNFLIGYIIFGIMTHEFIEHFWK